MNYVKAAHTQMLITYWTCIIFFIFSTSFTQCHYWTQTPWDWEWSPVRIDRFIIIIMIIYTISSISIASIRHIQLVKLTLWNSLFHLHMLSSVTKWAVFIWSEFKVENYPTLYANTQPLCHCLYTSIDALSWPTVTPYYFLIIHPDIRIVSS